MRSACFKAQLEFVFACVNGHISREQMTGPSQVCDIST